MSSLKKHFPVMPPPLESQEVDSFMMEDNNGQSTKRSKKTPFSSTATVLSSNSVFLRKKGMLEDDDSKEAFQCPVCHSMLQEPMISTCGHTFCKVCIIQALGSSTKCPKCSTPLTKDKVFPNDAMRIVIAKREREKSTHKFPSQSSSSSASAVEASVSSPSEIEEVLLGATDVDDLNLCGLDNLLLILQRKRELLARDEESTKHNLMLEFLSRLRALKNSEMDQLSWELSTLKGDLEALKTGGNSELKLKIFKTDNTYSTSPSSSSGFNTQPLRNVEVEQKSLAMRKKRMHTHFQELTQIYFETKKSKIIDDATVPRSLGVDDDFELLANFSQTLSRATQYHGLKQLATFSSAENTVPNANIVSSIEFDKDNEFFAVACTTKIQLFEYISVIGSGSEVKKRATSELPTDSKVSCVAWNLYFKNSLASSDLDGCVSLWDVEKSTKVRGFMEHQKRVWSVDWNASDPRLMASSSDDATVKLWSANTPKSIANIETQFSVCSVKFCPQNMYTVACGGADHHVYHYDFRNAKVPLSVFKGHDKAVSYVKFTGKSELVSASTDNTLKLWNLEEPTGYVKSFKGHINEKNFVGLGTDGNYVICGSENNSLYLYSKFLPTPLFSFKFDSHRILTEAGGKVDSVAEFVSAATWKKGSPVVVAGNSLGTIKILELM